jgi:hypothetical protein
VVRDTAGVEGQGEFRIEPDRLGVIRDGAVKLALLAVRDAAIAVGVGEIRIESDRLIEVRSGPVEVALVSICGAPVHVFDGEGIASQAAGFDRTRAGCDPFVAGSGQASIHIAGER